MKKLYFLLIIMLLPIFGFAQLEKKKFGINFTGYVKNDIIYDSRQTISPREGHFLLFPDKPLLDKFDKDVNDSPNFNMLAIQTRLHGDIYGPDAFGAKTSGMMEAEFFGHSDADINGFRLRHAYIKFNWTNSELLFGQFWHPLFVTSCFASTISFNTGAPFQPFSRNPQVRFTHKLGNFQFIGAAIAQRDFSSPGGSSLLRNSALPNLNAQLHYTQKLPDGMITTGFAIDYKKIRPRLMTDSLYFTDNTVDGTSFLYFLKFQVPAFTFKFEYVRGQNMYDHMMLGGYAINEISDISKNYLEYTPVQISSYWVDIHSNGEKFQAGVFAGYSANDGTVKENNGIYSSRGKDIAYLYRISPRIVFNSGKARFALECEYTAAAYLQPGTSIDNFGIIDNSEVVGNIRLLMGVYYFF
ncbi:DcaP family trimeric outer membrane transporter [Bacteroidota bacterium]